MNPTLTVDDLDFEVRRSRRRKTLQITVDRGGELVIIAPDHCDRSVMETFVREKRFWLYTKLAEKESLRRLTSTKEFVNGEGFPYLGRSFRLLLVDHQEVPLKLERGRFQLVRSEVPQGRTHFIRWYTQHAKVWLGDRVARLVRRVGVEPAAVEVRDLGFRWGSCGKRGVNFHWAAILLPPTVIEYIVVHELAHLREPHHTRAFWARVERAMPDFATRKAWLAEHGRGHVQL